MRKAQENFKFLKFFISLTLILYTILIFNLHTFLIQIFIYYPVISIVIPVWLLTFLSFSSNKIFGVKVRKETKHKIVFYSIFLTFLLLYFGLLPNFGQLILATSTTSTSTTSTSTTSTSTTIPACSCDQCGYYSSSNCNYACSEWQSCIQSSCSASGCISNPNCYKCEWKSCSQVNPKVYILTPFIVSGGNLTVSVYFECSQWAYSTKNLTLSLKIDNQDWSECFLNNKGLMTDFGWNSNCDMSRTMNGNCGSNYQWSCSQGTCYRTYNSWPIWTKSNFFFKSMNVTFTCKLPYLSGGSHSLTVIAKVYESEVILKPSVITFRVEETDGRKILEIILIPIKALRKLLPF